MAVPLAVLSDYVRGKRTSIEPLYIVGTLLIVLGFLLVNSHDQIMDRIRSLLPSEPAGSSGNLSVVENEDHKASSPAAAAVDADV